MGESAVPGDPASAVEDHAGGRRGGTEELRELPARFSVELQELLLLLREAVSRALVQGLLEASVAHLPHFAGDPGVPDGDDAHARIGEGVDDEEVRVVPGDLAAIRLAHVREGHGGVMRVQVLDLVFAHVEGGGEERDQGRLVERAVELEVRLPTGTDAGGEVVTGHARSDDAYARPRSEPVLDPQSAREGDALDIVLAACGDAQRVSARGERGDVE